MGRLAIGILGTLFMLAPFFTEPPASGSVPQAPSAFRGMTKDGAWCWFSDPRAVFYEGRFRRTYAGWVASDGSVVVGSYDHGTRIVEKAVIHEKLEIDDHDAPSLLFLPDGRLAAFYTLHSGKDMFLRVSEKPEDITAWGPRRRLPIEADDFGLTYTNPVRLSAEKGRIYLFWRGKGFKPQFSTTDDNGETWAAPRLLITSAGARPYVKIASNDRDTIHFAFTDGHPRNEPENSIYYLAYRSGRFMTADGTLVADAGGLPVECRRADIVYDGRKTGVRAWVWDTAADSEGRPVIVYTRLPSETDHRYHYARWDGRAWRDTELCPAGRWFPKTPEGKTEPEPHYSGGIALDHDDPSVVYLSRPVNGIFEIERWRTADGGATWASVSLTSGSEKDNVRPDVVRGHPPDGPAVLWMSNRRYIHYTKFDAALWMDVR